jgi:hypothetical protein
MTLQEEIAAIQARIAGAQAQRDTWRRSGMQEKYLEAYSLVEALELGLEQLRQEGLRSFARPTLREKHLTRPSESAAA